VGIAALAATVNLAACGTTGSEQAQPSTTTSVSATEAHNDADATFALHMIPHHQQAIEMSDMVLSKQGLDPRIVELATRIKAEQQPEINAMQSWLKQWQLPTEGMQPSEGMSPHGGMPGMDTMPGMAGMMSEQDMTALQNAQGTEAGTLFLKQMIRHHQGAITMAQNEVDNGRYPAALEMARAIIVDQQAEIETMNEILATPR